MRGSQGGTIARSGWLQSLSDRIAGLTHDVGTPLTVVTLQMDRVRARAHHMLHWLENRLRDGQVSEAELKRVLADQQELLESLQRATRELAALRALLESWSFESRRELEGS